MLDALGRVDVDQLKEVLVNLVVNACEAMVSGGAIVVEERVNAEPPQGHAAVIRVRDNGPGIPAHLLEQIFQPFFSTKEQGTGLGLSIAQRIVTQFLPYAQENIGPAVRSGKRVLIVAHGNTLRGLIKYAERISDTEIADLNIPTAIPLVYELEDDMKPIRRYYLGDQESVKKAAESVANQAKGKI